MEVEKFTFLKVFADSITELAKEDEQLAQKLCRRIFQYGIYGKDQKSDSSIVEALFIQIKPMIDKGRQITIANSENGKQGGRGKKQNKSETKAKQNPTKSETKAKKSNIEHITYNIEQGTNNIEQENNISISYDIETETKVSEFGNKDVNECLKIIKSFNGGLLDGTIKSNRRYAKLLIDKLNKLESIQNGKYTRNQTLELILSIIQKNKYHSSKITSAESIYHNLAILMQACKNDVGKAQTSQIILPTI